MPDTCVDSIGKTCVEASAMSISKFRSPASTTSLRQWSGVAWRRDRKLSHLILGTWLWRCCRLHISVFFTPNLHRRKTAALFVAWFLFTRWKCQEPDWGSDSRKQTIDTITTSVPKKVWLFRSPNKKAGNHLQKPQKPSRGDLQNIPKWESDQSLANFEDADSGRNIGPLGKYWFYRSRRTFIGQCTRVFKKTGKFFQASTFLGCDTVIPSPLILNTLNTFTPKWIDPILSHGFKWTISYYPPEIKRGKGKSLKIYAFF